MKNLWSEKIAGELDGLDLLVYATHLIGQDPDLVLWGGGNSSAKLEGSDHLGRKVPILWIKGSGSDMKTMTASQFTALRLEDLLALRDREEMADEDMVAYLRCCTMNPSSPKPSIETLLHAFLPAPHVYHTHADAVCAITDTGNSQSLVQELYGTDVALIPYIRPGFRLAKLVERAYYQGSRLRAIILDKHGLVTWGDSPKEAYSSTINIVSKAEEFIRDVGGPRSGSKQTASCGASSADRHRLASSVAPLLRGALGHSLRTLLSYDDSPDILNFVNDPRSRELSQVGPFTPDHILHTKAFPLRLEIPERASQETLASCIQEQVEAYRSRYRDYFERYKSAGVSMLDPNPRVILVPGAGMFAAGRDPRACRITRDLYEHTMRVIRASSSIGTYTSLSIQDLCDFEYWPMENYKLTLLPPEKELSRRVALVTGAAGSLGRAISTKLVREGASVVLADLDVEKLNNLSEELNRDAGQQATTPVRMDVTSEEGVAEAFQKAVLTYGGLDILVSNAGIARSGSMASLSLKDWNDCLAVNATGHFLVCRETIRLFKQQGLGGNITVVATKNVPAPGKEFGAYSASKAAQAQVARILAIEGAELGVRVNMVNPDGVLEGSGLWSEDIRAARAKSYGIPVESLQDHMVAKTLLKVKVSPQDVAEAVFFLASDRSSKTTGAMIPVDGGIREAFPR